MAKTQLINHLISLYSHIKEKIALAFEVTSALEKIRTFAHQEKAIPSAYAVPSLAALSCVALLSVGIGQLSAHSHIHQSAHQKIRLTAH